MFGGFETTFWQDRLEVGTDLIEQQLVDDDYMERWVHRLSPRCRGLLLEHLGILPSPLLSEVRAKIIEQRERLRPFLLVTAATTGKRSYTIAEVARAKLSVAQMLRCQIKSGTGRFDREALMWLLYLQAPENLELVFRLDQCQRRGFARMVLHKPPSTNESAVANLFQPTNMQALLDEFEEKHRTFRRSYCADVLHDGGNYQVFIKRDTKESFVSHGAKNTFGFEREWIILDFEPDLRHVHISSVSSDVPLQLANCVAMQVFGESVGYENDTIETKPDKVLRFLNGLIREPNKLPLVEVTAQNCGLDGAPQIRINERQNGSIALPLRQFARAFGNPLQHPEDIDSIKVYAFKKRVKLTFEETAGQFVVRYADQPLNGTERRSFEQMMEQEHEIIVLSTEKRYAR